MLAWHSIDEWFHRLVPALVALALAAWMIAFITVWRRKRRRGIPRTIAEIQLRTRPMPPLFFYAAGIFALIVIGTMIVTTLIGNQGAAEVRSFLARPIQSVRINGCTLTDADGFVNGLRGGLKPFAFYMGHHSHPTLNFQVILRSGGRDLTLILARDSGDPQEYWVYYPAYNVSLIAHVDTPYLDGC